MRNRIVCYVSQAKTAMLVQACSQHLLACDVICIGRTAIMLQFVLFLMLQDDLNLLQQYNGKNKGLSILPVGGTYILKSVFRFVPVMNSKSSRKDHDSIVSVNLISSTVANILKRRRRFSVDGK